MQKPPITNIGIPGGMYFGTRGWQYDDTGEGYGAGYGSNTGGSSGDNSSGQSSDSQDDTNGDSQGGSKNDKDPVKVQIDLINELEQLLNGDYAFTIYAANEKQKSVNYGVHLTNRIRMEPTTYQAGELVKTVTLAPNEVRKYTSKTVIKRKRSEKEAAKSSFVRKEDMSETSRAESEIIRKALTKTNFSLMAQGTYSLGFASGNSTINVGTDAENSSSETKKGFMEAVTKASQEYKSERTVEVAFEESTDFEFTESGEMNNKNDSVAVTYLFFELQRRFRVFQELYRIVPVVLVAQEVPRPDEITDSWIVRYAWILRRSLLSDEFLPAISYLDSHVAGDLAALVHLRKNVKTQDGIVNKLEENLKLLRERTERSYTILQKRMERVASEIEEEDSDGFFGDIGDFFGSGGESPDAARAREAAAREAFERTVKKEQDLAMRLDSAVVALNQAVDELAKAERTHQNHRVQILKLRVHIVQNILYYMQAIWAHEVSDQRFFRLHQVPVPIFEDAGTMYEFSGTEAFKHFVNEGTSFEEAVAHAFEIKPNISVSFDVKTLGEIADLDNPLGFKGNYIIYPLKEGEENALTEFLMMPYIDSGWRAIDPDEAGNMNLEEFEEFVRCLHEHMSEEEFAEIKPKLEEHYSLLITSGVRPGDEIIVPTGSLFIEALPASHYLLERFKEKHRELDVMKVKAEVRGKELRNLRAAARMLAAEDDTSLLDDPDIESVKRVIVSGDGVQPNIDVGSDL